MSFFLLGVFIVVYLPPIWMLILYEWVDARRSGWKNLARLYRVGQEPSGRRFENIVLRLNTRQYCGIATVVMNSKGLYISLIPRFIPFHPPVVVPWGSMKVVKAGSTTAFELKAQAP